MGVVTCGSEEAAIGTEFEHPAMVAAFTTLGGPFDDLLFIGKSVFPDSEAANALPNEIGRRVKKEEVIVLFKVWIESDAEETIFLFSEDLDFSEGGALPGRRVNAAHLALEFDEINGSIGSEVHAHRAGEVFRDGFDLKAEGVCRRCERAEEEEDE